MKFDINTLKRALCAVIATTALLLGTWTTAEAQRRYDRYYGGQRNYGQQRRRQNRYWRNQRHNLQRHQRYERQVLRDRLRGDNDDNDNWRRNRKYARQQLKRHQKYERQEFKERFKNRRRNH